jgi:hypothetical protein
VDYHIENLSAENIRDLIPLYKAVFREAVSAKALLSKYDTRSIGPEFTGFIAYTSSGTTAAYYGVIPCFFQLNGEKVIALRHNLPIR